MLVLLGDIRLSDEWYESDAGCGERRFDGEGVDDASCCCFFSAVISLFLLFFFSRSSTLTSRLPETATSCLTFSFTSLDEDAGPTEDGAALGTGGGLSFILARAYAVSVGTAGLSFRETATWGCGSGVTTAAASADEDNATLVGTLCLSAATIRAQLLAVFGEAPTLEALAGDDAGRPDPPCLSTTKNRNMT